MKQLLKDLKAKPIFWLGVFIPIVLVMHWMHIGSNSLMFLISLLAIIPLGGFISHATEGVVAKTGDAIGGLLNATLGNLTELVIVIMILFATLSVFMVASSGKTAWYLGIPLLAVYAIFGLTLYFL